MITVSLQINEVNGHVMSRAVSESSTATLLEMANLKGVLDSLSQPDNLVHLQARNVLTVFNERRK